MRPLDILARLGLSLLFAFVVAVIIPLALVVTLAVIAWDMAGELGSAVGRGVVGLAQFARSVGEAFMILWMAEL